MNPGPGYGRAVGDPGTVPGLRNGQYMARSSPAGPPCRARLDLVFFDQDFFPSRYGYVLCIFGRYGHVRAPCEERHGEERSKPLILHSM